MKGNGKRKMKRRNRRSQRNKRILGFLTAVILVAIIGVVAASITNKSEAVVSAETTADTDNFVGATTVTWRVCAGDSVWSICERLHAEYQVEHDSVGEMFDRTLRINGIDPEGVIRIGSSLKVQFYI